MSETNAERLDRCKQFANSEDIDWLIKKVREFESKLRYMTHHRDELVERVQELELENKERHELNVKQTNEIECLRAIDKEKTAVLYHSYDDITRLRKAIAQSIEKHKWNNEESARILEQALETGELKFQKKKK